MHAVFPEVPELVIDHRLGAPGAGASAGAPHQTWRDNEGRLVATGGFDGRLWWMHWDGLATFFFLDAGPVTATPVGSHSDAEIRDIFVRGVLPVVMLARGCEALHASAIAVGAAGLVALVAQSGTGKSSLALAMTAHAGARQVADDTLVYRVVDDQPFALPLPFPIRVDEAARDAVAGLQQPSTQEAPVQSLPLRRVYQLSRDPSVDPFAPRFTPVADRRRFEVLLSHSHPFDMGPEGRQRAFHEHLLAVARHTEVWDCRFAPALAALPSLADHLVEHVTRT